MVFRTRPKARFDLGDDDVAVQVAAAVADLESPV